MTISLLRPETASSSDSRNLTFEIIAFLQAIPTGPDPIANSESYCQLVTVGLEVRAPQKIEKCVTNVPTHLSGYSNLANLTPRTVLKMVYDF